MHTENQVTIFASIDRVFALGAEIAEWPAILPHYRFVKVVTDDGRVRQAVMGAKRDWIPVGWRTSQVLIAEENRILFFHTGGITRGMYVEWILQLVSENGRSGVQVTIAHDLDYPIPILTRWFARDIVGGLFVSHIAGKTLARIKQIAEGELTKESEAL